MSAADLWEDLGGGVPPAPSRPATPRHHEWKLTAKQHAISRHRCIHCGTVRTRITRDGAFPQTKYMAADGRYSVRSPPCKAQR